MDTQTPSVGRIVTGLLCRMFGLTILVSCLLYLLIVWAMAPRWQSVTGMIVKREINWQSGGRSSRGSANLGSYHPEITYSYQVAGQDYTSRRIGDGTTGRNYYIRSFAHRAIDRYPFGPVTVYYDPTNPARSALDPSVLNGLVLGLSGFGLLLAAIGYRMRRKDAAAKARMTVMS